MIRKNMGLGKGQGYKNMTNLDSHIHSLSAQGVKSVNIPRYMGKWNSQGSIPQFFDKDCMKSRAKYTYLPKEQRIEVVNKCDKPDGVSTITGTARSVSQNNKKLKVSFFPLIEGDYIIEYLDKGYNYVIVGYPDKEYLWIMSRKEKISPSKHNQLKQIAKSKGYDINLIKNQR